MAKTDENGKFTIKNLPVGRHIFQLWHEKAGYLRHMNIGDHRTDRKGRLTIDIRQGANSWDVALAPSEFDD